MDVRVGLWRKLIAKECMLLNCGVGEDSWESLGLQRDPTTPSEGDQLWDFFGRNDAKAETPVLWPPHLRVDSLEKTLMLGGIGGRRRRGWQSLDGWMASLTRWTWIWVNSGSWWWTRRPGVLRFMGLQKLDRTEQLNWTELNTQSALQGSPHYSKGSSFQLLTVQPKAHSLSL